MTISTSSSVEDKGAMFLRLSSVKENRMENTSGEHMAETGATPSQEEKCNMNEEPIAKDTLEDIDVAGDSASRKRNITVGSESSWLYLCLEPDQAHTPLDTAMETLEDLKFDPEKDRPCNLKVSRSVVDMATELGNPVSSKGQISAIPERVRGQPRRLSVISETTITDNSPSMSSRQRKTTD